MLIKLPVISNDRLSFILFRLVKNKDSFLIEPYNKENKIYQVMISDKNICLSKFQIKFPLELKIIDNKYLFCNYFFVLAIHDNYFCELNFFNSLLKQINKNHNDRFKYVDINFIKKNRQFITQNIIKDRDKFNDLDDLIHYFDSKLTYTLNLIYMILYFYQNNKKKKSESKNIKKDFLTALDTIKRREISVKSSMNLPIYKHFDNISNNKLVDNDPDINKKYFIKVKNNIFNFIATDKDKETLYNNIRKMNKTEIFYIYNPEYSDLYNIDYLIKHVIEYDYDFRFLIAHKILNQDKQGINLFLKFMYRDNENFLYLSSLKKFKYTFENLEYEKYNNNDSIELEILKDGVNDINYIKYLNNKHKDNYDKKIDILKALFNNYTFPLTFNKKSLNKDFEYILYFSFVNISEFIKDIDGKIFLNSDIIEILPSKLKNIYFNMLKLYYQFINGVLESIKYNHKFYQEYLHIYLLKNIIQNNTIITTFFEENSQLFKKLKDTYKTIFILYQIIPEIRWDILYKKLDYIDYILDNNVMLYFNNSINKNIFPDNYDNKIKNILTNPFKMYKYLKKEKDYINWTLFLKNRIFELYDNTISLSNNDLKHIGIMIHKLLNVTDQDLDDDKYMDLVVFCQNNKKIILYQNRININIKNKLPNMKCQFNLGVFAKHINFNNYKQIEIENKDEEFKKIQKKYYKYKAKYLMEKMDDDAMSTISEYVKLKNQTEAE